MPTDCPQRDERLGWTGDAQVFIRTACYNFDAEAFYRKWLADLSADQSENGMVCHVIPAVMDVRYGSAAWSDAATVCPWELYLAYGDPQILKDQFESMKKWVDYITLTTTTQNLPTGGEHYGDWLGLDAPSGSYKGSTREEFIASVFYAYSTELVIRTGKVLGADVSSYEKLYADIVNAFRDAYPVYTTQTECVLAAHFHLAPDCQSAADQLAGMIKDCGTAASDRICRYSLPAPCPVRLRIWRPGLVTAPAPGISVLALSCHKRRDYRMGALGRHYGRRRLLESRYEFL